MAERPEPSELVRQRRRRAFDASAEDGVVPGGYNAAMAVGGAVTAYEEELRREVEDGSMAERANRAFWRAGGGRHAMRLALEAALFGGSE